MWLEEGGGGERGAALFLQTAGLAFLQLEDRSAGFTQFLDNLTGAQQDKPDCREVFPDC